MCDERVTAVQPRNDHGSTVVQPRIDPLTANRSPLPSGHSNTAFWVGRSDSAQWFEDLIFDAGIVEVRIATASGGWRSRWFDAADELIGFLRGLPAGATAYSSLNRPRSDHLRRGALRDADVQTITRIVFDFDPIRPPGAPSTEAELQGAYKCALELVRMLRAFGWPQAAIGQSGNGVHVVFRTKLKATPAWKQTAGALYFALRGRLSESCREHGVIFDCSVRNPARVWRIYGTLNPKGEPTLERPHRVASIRLPRSGWQPVRADVIQRTVDALSPVVEQRRQSRPVGSAKPRGRGDFNTLDVVAWMKAHGLYIVDLAPGKHSIRCPWGDEHTTPSPPNGSDTVVWEAGDAWPTFHCSHAHCVGRGIRDVMELFGDADAFCAATWRGDR